MSPMIRYAALTFAALVTGCSSPEPANETVSLEMTDINRGQVFAMFIPEQTGEAEIIAAAKGRCDGMQWCQVMGWRDRANMPSAMPMLDREAGSVSFNYLLNRASGTERVMWDCKLFPGKPPEQCLG